jgi:hypothetical protein
MIDVATKKPLRVETDRTVGPYMRVSVPQLDAIRQLLERYKIGFRIDEHAISINEGPEMTYVYHIAAGIKFNISDAAIAKVS